MILYSDLCENGKIVKRFWDFGYAQQFCGEIEAAGYPFSLWLIDENREVICELTKFRIPRLQTSPH